MHSIETNPASLSIRLSELFPQGALTAELQGAGDPGALYPDEAKHLRKAVRKRAEEFAAGRLCARLLLHEFGVENFAVEVGSERQPLWPAALVGSITHTSGFCAAVVAPRKSLRAVGIDTEMAGGVKPELWRSICTPKESAWLRSLSNGEQVAAGTVIFSAKEAFYKCQFPLTEQYLGFQDVSVELPEWGRECGSFTVRANRGIDLETKAELPLRGRYRFHEQFITSGIAVPEALS